MAWHPDVQENAWEDTAVATDWVANTLAPFISEEGEAWNRMQNDVKYLSIIRNTFLHTGCLLTAYCEYDDLVCPVGIPDYEVPHPSMVEPIQHLQNAMNMLKVLFMQNE